MYHQLTLAQRLIIENMLARGAGQSAIARALGVHRSTVKRELERNSQNGNYSAEDAHAVTLYRKKMSGTLSQMGKKKTAEDFEKKNTSSQRKRTRLSKCRIHSTYRKYLRYRPYQIYIKRKDERNYKLHPNKGRPDIYQLNKKLYESNYRFRDNAEAERKRLPRSRKDFLNYNTNTLSKALRYERMAHRAWRKIKREGIIQKEIRFERYMRQLDDELRQIRESWKRKKIQRKEFKQKQLPQITIEAKQQTAFVFLFYEKTTDLFLFRSVLRAP